MAIAPITIRPYSTNTVPAGQPGAGSPEPWNARAWLQTGAANIGSALRDNTDASYAYLPIGSTLGNTLMQALWFDPSTLVFPTGSQVRSMTGRLRWKWTGDGGEPKVHIKFGIQDPAQWGVDLTYTYDTNIAPPISVFSPFTTTSTVYGVTAAHASSITWYADITGAPDPNSLAMAGTVQISEAYLDVYYNEPPTVTTGTGISITNLVSGAINTAQPQINWVYADPEGDTQERYKVAIWKTSDIQGSIQPFAANNHTTWGTIFSVFYSGEVYGTATSVTIPPGLLQNGINYTAYVAVADTGSDGRYSYAKGSYDSIAFTVTIDPLLMPTLQIGPTGGLHHDTVAEHGGVSYDEATGQIDGLTVGARANFLTQVDASFESGATPSLGSWVLTGGGTVAASAVYPYMGTSHARATANSSGTGHVIYTSPKVTHGAIPYPGLGSQTILTFLAHVRPVASAGNAAVVTLQALFYDVNNALLATSPVTSQHVGHTASGTTYKKLWLQCPIPAAATQCAMRIDIGPCAASAQFDIDCCAIAPFVPNLLDNASFEVTSPTMWVASTSGSNAVSFSTADRSTEFAGGSSCADCTYATVAGSDYFQPADKANGPSTIAHEGGANFVLSGSYKLASGTATTAWLFLWDTVTDYPTRPGIASGVTSSWQRFSVYSATSAVAGTVDLRLIAGANSAETVAHHLRIDNLQVEPVWGLVNGTMENGVNATTMDTTVALGQSTTPNNKGWIHESIASGNSKCYYTSGVAHAGTISARIDMVVANPVAQGFCQYFTIAGLSSVQGSFYTRTTNAGIFFGTLAQYDSGGVEVQADNILFIGGTSSVWTLRSFDIPTHPAAAYAKISFSLASATNTAQDANAWVDDVVITLPLAQVYGTYLYGPPNSFGNLADDNELPGGQPLAIVPTPTYALGAGLSSWYAEALSDGKIAIGTQPQFIDPFEPTTDHCEIDIFDPATNTWKVVTIPTSTGRTTAVWPGYPTGGQEIADLGSVTIAAVYSLCWLSGGWVWAWDISTVGQYPILGFLKLVSGVWQIDRTYTADQVYQSNPAADTAGLFTPVTNVGGTYYDAKAPAEFDVTPASNYLVITHYFSKGTTRSGFVSVVDPATGTLKATYQFPDITDRNGKLIRFFPREVQCDPTSSAGDERFVVLSDTFGEDNGSGLPAEDAHAIVELSFNNGNNTIVLKSIPVIPEMNNSTIEIGTADYDSVGNLWVFCQQGLAPRNLCVWAKSGGGTISAVAPIASYPNWNTAGNYATRVRPTLTCPGTTRCSWSSSLTLDNTNHIAYVVGADGILVPVTWTAGLALGANALAADQSTFEGGTQAYTAIFATASLAVSATVAHSGTNSLRFTSTSPSGMVAVTNSTQAVTQGQQYRIGAWVRAGAGMLGVKSYVSARWYNSAGTQVSAAPSAVGGLVATNRGENWYNTFTATDSTSAWTFIYTDVDPPADAVTCDIVVGFFTLATGQIHYVDDVTFQTLPFTVRNIDLRVNTLRVTSAGDMAANKAAMSSNFLYVPTYTKKHFNVVYNRSEVPSTLPQFLYKVALTSGGSPPAQQVGATQYLDGGWSGGGLLGSFLGVPAIGVVSLQRSTDRLTWSGVRGLQDSSPKAATTTGFGTFGPTFRWTWDDYEWDIVPNDEDDQTLYYRARFVGTAASGGSQASLPGRDYAVTPADPLTVSEWLLIDPLDSANNYTLSVKTFKAETMESYGEFTPVGRNRRVIIGDTMLGDTITLEVFCLTNAGFEALKAVINQQATLMLRSPDGYSWYVRATKRSITRTWTGTYAQPLRTVNVVFSEVDPVT